MPRDFASRLDEQPDHHFDVTGLLFDLPQEPERGLVPAGSLVKQPDGSYVYKGTGVHLDRLGADFPEMVDSSSFMELGEVLLHIENRVQLWIGDWLVAAERLFDVSLEDIAAQVGRKPKTLYEYYRVCKNVPKSMRLDNLTFTHYQVVAAVDDPVLRADYLRQASEQDWSSGVLSTVVNPPAPRSLFEQFIGLYGKEGAKLRQWADRAGETERRNMIVLLRQMLSLLES